MRSPAEAGQKVLMLGDDFWLLMPGSQRRAAHHADRRSCWATLPPATSPP
jgi:hypothetical protein